VDFVTRAHNGAPCGRYADFLADQDLADAGRTWLDPASVKDDLFDAAHADAPALAWHEVGKAVGPVGNNWPELVEPTF